MRRMWKWFLLVCFLFGAAACAAAPQPLPITPPSASVTRVVTSITIVPTREPTPTPDPAKTATPEPRILALYVEANEALGFPEDIRMYSDGFITLGAEEYQISSAQMEIFMMNMQFYVMDLVVAQQTNLIEKDCAACSEINLNYYFFLEPYEQILYLANQITFKENVSARVIQSVEVSSTFTLNYLRNFIKQIAMPHQDKKLMLEVHFGNQHSPATFYSDYTATLEERGRTYPISETQLDNVLSEIDRLRFLDTANGNQELSITLGPCDECVNFVRYYSVIAEQMMTMNLDSIPENQKLSLILNSLDRLFYDAFGDAWKDE